MALAFRNIRKGLVQHEALTGRKATPAVISSIVEEDLRQKAGRAVENRRLDIASEQFETQQQFAEESRTFNQNQILEQNRLNREALERSEGANVLTGISELATGAVALKGAATKLGIIKGAADTGTAVGSATATTTSGVSGTGGTAADVLASGALTEGGGTTAVTAATPATTVAAEAGGTTTAAAGGSVLGAAGAGAGAGAVGGFIGQKLTKAGEEGHKGGEVWTGRAIGGVLGAAGGFWAGAQIGATLGPVGAIIGGVIGFISGGGSVICTELHAQGLMTKEMLGLEEEFKSKYVGWITYEGYLEFAKPIVPLMKKSKLFTKLVASIAMPWAYQMAHLVKPKEYPENRFGRFVMKYGMKYCLWKGKRKLVSEGILEVNHG